MAIGTLEVDGTQASSDVSDLWDKE